MLKMEMLIPRRMLSNYQKLHKQEEEEEEEDGGGVVSTSRWDGGEFTGRPAGRSINWFKFRRFQWRKRSRRRRRRRRRPSSSFFRLKVSSLVRRRRNAMVKMFRVSIRKVLKRFKEGQDHFGDLFAGNYLFLQINPSSLKSLQKAYTLPRPPQANF
ncbi:hypothetical protein LINGRAHAP2_LOCUS34493 [Linum grandiflorum]